MKAKRVGLASLPVMLALTALSSAALCQEAAKDWPCWRGPYGTGAAVPSGAKLLEDLSQAKVVWESDQTIPGARVADARKAVPKDQAQMSGGFASPVLADGRVYITYYVPNGVEYDQSIAARHEAVGGYGKEKWYVDTDDVIHCFDAATGKTLWKRAFQGRGMNFNLFNKGGPCNLTACVSGGKVYAIGSAGRVYCVDAKTGQPVWESDVGERAKRMEELRQICKKQKRIPQFNRDMSSSPVVADGVVVCSDFLGYKVQQPIEQYNWADSCGLVGLDAATGRRLWAIPKSLGNWASPAKWTHQGKQYVIAASSEGKAICVAPRTGKVLWETAVGKHGYTVTVGEDHLICNADPEGGRLACYRLSTTGATQVWALPAQYGYADASLPVIHNGHVYARCKGAGFVCVELKTGRIAGEVAMSGGLGFVVVMDGLVLVDADNSHDRDEVFVLSADPANFRQLGVWQAPNATGYMNPVTPAAAEGRLYMRVLDRIRCYDLRQ